MGYVRPMVWIALAVSALGVGMMLGRDMADSTRLPMTLVAISLLVALMMWGSDE